MSTRRAFFGRIHILTYYILSSNKLLFAIDGELDEEAAEKHNLEKAVGQILNEVLEENFQELTEKGFQDVQ